MFGRREKELTLACTYGSSVLKNNSPIPSPGLNLIAISFFVSEIASEVVLSWTNDDKSTKVQRPELQDIFPNKWKEKYWRGRRIKSVSLHGYRNKMKTIFVRVWSAVPSTRRRPACSHVLMTIQEAHIWLNSSFWVETLMYNEMHNLTKRNISDQPKISRRLVNNLNKIPPLVSILSHMNLAPLRFILILFSTNINISRNLLKFQQICEYQAPMSWNTSRFIPH
jgi:hypothetical protein